MGKLSTIPEPKTEFSKLTVGNTFTTKEKRVVYMKTDDARGSASGDSRFINAVIIDVLDPNWHIGNYFYFEQKDLVLKLNRHESTYDIVSF